jgi:hypothetical protein
LLTILIPLRALVPAEQKQNHARLSARATSNGRTAETDRLFDQFVGKR